MRNTRQKKEFGEGAVYTFSTYIMWFLQGNFYFWLMNIPFIFVLALIFLSENSDLSLLLAISAIPMGPALTALFSIMGKLVREKDLNVTEDFFKYYKLNFFESLFFWILELLVFFVIYADKMYAMSVIGVQALQLIFLVLMFLCVSLTFHLFPIISRFYLKKSIAIRLALYYSIKKIHISILSLGLIYIMWNALLKIPSISLLIILLSVSIVCYMVMRFYNNTLLELEEKFKNADR